MERALCFAIENLVPKCTTVAGFLLEYVQSHGHSAASGSLRSTLSRGSMSLLAPPAQFSGLGNDLMFAVLSTCPTPLAGLESKRILKDCPMQS